VSQVLVQFVINLDSVSQCMIVYPGTCIKAYERDTSTSPAFF